MSRPLRQAFLWLALLPVLIDPAQAAGSTDGPSGTTLFFVQITLLLIVARCLGEVCERAGLPAVMGQLLGGILLGPSLFGLVWPEAQHLIFPVEAERRQMLEGVAQIGIVLLLLLTGMETDFALLRRSRSAPFWVSLFGILLPFACGVALGWIMPAFLLPHPELRIPAALFVGTALSISSVKILAMVIRQAGFLRRNIGQLMLAAAIIDDTIGWMTIGIVLGVVKRGSVDTVALAWSIAGTAVFLGLSLTIGRRLVARLIRWSNDTLESEFPVVTTIIVVTCLMALATESIGVHSVLGAFIAGVIIGQSPILTRHIDEQLRGLIGALFAPVFFGLAGLRTDLTVLAEPRILVLTLALVLIASIGKFMGAFVGGRIAGLGWNEALAIGCGMNARGSTEIIVATLGLSTGALGRDLYTMIVTMAVVTTLVMPPTLRWALARLPVSEEERSRIEREESEAKRFVPNIERVLAVVDNGANGLLAARVAGLLAASGRVVPTVLPVAASLDSAAVSDDTAAAATTEAAVGAEAARQQNGATLAADDRGRSGNEPDVDVRKATERATASDAIERERDKGFGLLLIGMSDVTGADRAISAQVSEMVEKFSGPFAILIARGRLAREPKRTPLRIFTAVSGTAASRRAAELAVEIAGPAGAPLEAMHVSTGAAASAKRHGYMRWRTVLGTGSAELAALREIQEIAEQRHVEFRPVHVSSREPAAAILAAMEAADNGLLVIGVNPRSGDQLAFGEVASRLLGEASCSLLFLSS